MDCSTLNRSILDSFEDPKAAGRGKAKSPVSLDDAFLGFGFGKHACPGRFFALHEMKLFVAHMLLNYEIEPLPTRAPAWPLVWLNLPLNGAKIRVRRRAES